MQGDAGYDTLVGTDGNDAIALDDPLSPFPGEISPRLSGIERIQAGGGNDVVDLTSRRYEYDDVRIDGGIGNDTLWANSGADVLVGNAGHDNLYGGAGNDTLHGGEDNDILDGGRGADTMIGGTGNDTYVIDEIGDTITESAHEGKDTVKSAISYSLGANVENLTLTGTAAINATGNAQNNILTGNGGANVLAGGAGNDTLKGGAGKDTYLFNRGDGQDKIFDNDGTSGNTDTVLFGSQIDPMDLIISRSVNDLKLSVAGSSDRPTVQNWYADSSYHMELIQAGNGQQLVNTQVDQLTQAMATFSAQSGLTWEQAVAQRPEDVQMILAASWQ